MDPLILLSVDPGVNSSGLAFWRGDKLAQVEFMAPTGGHFDGPTIDNLIIELPQVYQGRAQKGDPNDLVNLAFEVGRIVATLDIPFETVKPRQWKGTVKKEIMLKRILSKLTNEELLLIKGLGLSKSQEHNCIDAIGIGLWKLGRL